MNCPLPDEIISEILSPALKVSDEAFSDTLSTSPFASYSQSTSAYLLVCKAWLRVSTPLLYNVVVVRSRAQARALEAALKSNKDLGAFIKKLRVEGGYGSTMKTILKCSPNITDLVISLAIWSSDSVSGLCQGLDLIDPVRLIIHDVEEPGNNQQNLRLVQTLIGRIHRWNRLRVVELPYAYDWDSEVTRCARVCSALKDAPSLEEVIIPQCFGLPAFVADIRDNTSLKKVKIKRPIPPEWLNALLIGIQEDPKLTEILEYSVLQLDGPGIAPASNPTFVPMQSASPEVQEKIWTRIIYFALDTDPLDADLASPVHVAKRFTDRLVFIYGRLEIMLVSKQFKRLSTPYFYRHVFLDLYGHLANFSAAIIKNPQIAPYIRALCVDKTAVRSELPDIDWVEPSEENEFASETEELLGPILPLLDGLIAFTGANYDIASYPPYPQISEESVTITWGTFRMLGETAGPTLQRFSVEISSPAQFQTPLIFQPFLALRSLEWKCLAQFSLDPEPVWASEALRNLECLSLVDYHHTFLTVLTKAELPSLRRVYFHDIPALSAEGFLRHHGSKLVEIMLPQWQLNVLDICRDLPVLIFNNNESDETNILPPIKLLSPTKPHHSLIKVVLEAYFVYTRKEEQAMTLFWKSIDEEMLPALREIQVYQLTWPTTEREISKSYWVRWAELLLEKGIKLTDMDGKHWTPRLKVGRR
ncbi:hypothetical protein B0H11DRAFT_2026025 [Mycena galericulata]|nr:hypothetical protein B0H11DRAFT_2026025 [Mycena galericulata]